MPQDKEVADDEVLAGPRIMLRVPRAEDAEELFARVSSDPAVTEFLTWRPHHDVGETRRTITTLFNTGGEHTWVIALRVTGELVGEFGYWRPQVHAVELGYCLARQWWGQGLMSEALGVVLERFGRDRSLHRVWAACHVNNTRSARVLERAGLSLEGRMRRYAIFPNLGPDPQDALLFAKALKKG